MPGDIPNIDLTFLLTLNPAEVLLGLAAVACYLHVLNWLYYIHRYDRWYD